MANTKYDAAWSLDEAAELIQKLTPLLLAKGFMVGLTGSVLVKGKSEHDVDLIVYPMQSIGWRQSDWVPARAALVAAGLVLYVNMSAVKDSWRRRGIGDEKMVEVYHYNERRVDVFFLR